MNLITIDFETYYSREYSLTKMTTEEYIRSPFFEVIGVADTYFSGSGYSIAPVVGIIPPDLVLQPNPEEVDAFFEVPLAFLLDPANSVRKEAAWNGQQRSYYDMQWGERRIWGVTAGIIANLVRRLA